MKRIISGSRKEGLRISSSAIDLFFYLTNHHVVWDVTQYVYDSDSETVFFMEYQDDLPGTAYLRLINMHSSNDTISKLSCIQRNYHTYISSKLFLQNAESYCRGNKVFQHGSCHTSVFDDTECDYA